MWKHQILTHNKCCVAINVNGFASFYQLAKQSESTVAWIGGEIANNVFMQHTIICIDRFQIIMTHLWQINVAW